MPRIMHELLSGSKMAPVSASLERKGRFKTPPWCSGLMVPVALRKQIITKIASERQGMQTQADLIYLIIFSLFAKCESGRSVIGLIRVLPLNSLRSYSGSSWIA